MMKGAKVTGSSIKNKPQAKSQKRRQESINRTLDPSVKFTGDKAMVEMPETEEETRKYMPLKKPGTPSKAILSNISSGRPSAGKYLS